MKLPSGPHHSMNLCEHDRPIKDDRRYGTDLQTGIYDLTVSISQNGSWHAKIVVPLERGVGY
ncbi:hypothetical protein N7499_011513 [Penicillium canescens]|uniref:Uncharacterized protein n=1 Tax=Penicillium canescens TaxID=5083 RepID=A0AAD6ILR6_PENCN|nr:uncharacterized protein N7446_006772 [Penicillium canescens]KAJ5990968.1 hypothetical protein N7522_011175 [Penicillium canescens]KAJ6049901.1 hypothetical protein N7444_006617 [Penicillium canescens]KAJ6052130.1 hypothetical protein N7460_002664 [Penicillium canescens]KAJ6062652.1 hypothetical protein N7446_006772 [Penicillium canescens]KAJ6069626.1 hypothetical protein N7499_011513 [Penicillium canescens]